MRRSLGFTLIELMIVVAIISVLVVIAIPSLVRSRMSANETAAIAGCKAISEAEYVYKRTDYDSDGVLEFAQTMSGNNSLLESIAGVADLGLIEKSLASAEGQPGTVTAKAGYVYYILTQQGPQAEGGSRNYITPNPGGAATSMTLGHGVCAIPAAYDVSGRSAFIINDYGTVYQKDRGATGVQETWYNPDSTWTVAQ